MLARLASPRGGDDVAAAGALAWLLLPGACTLAYRLRTLSPRIDEVVAAQLWLEVRSFSWELRKVAANVLLNTRRGVLRGFEVGDHAREVDPTWSRSELVEPDARLWALRDANAPAPAMDPERELDAVLNHAIRSGAIAPWERDLLVTLATEADTAGVARSGWRPRRPVLRRRQSQRGSLVGHLRGDGSTSRDGGLGRGDGHRHPDAGGVVSLAAPLPACGWRGDGSGR